MTTNAADAQGSVKFRKKPVVIEAVQLDGTLEAFEAAVAFMGTAGGAHNGHLENDDPHKSWLYIDTLEGQMVAHTGDWIIRGVKGEFYPCKPDIFAATYEPAGDSLADRQGEAVAGEMDRSAPPRVWLQVDTDGDETDRTEAIPEDSWERLTWHFEPLGWQEIEYVRADLCSPAPGAGTTEESHVEWCRRMAISEIGQEVRAGSFGIDDSPAPAAVTDAMVERARVAYVRAIESQSTLTQNSQCVARAILTAALQIGGE